MQIKTFIFFAVCFIMCSSLRELEVPHVSLYLYARGMGANLGCVTYLDDVVLDKYKDNQFTIKQLSEMARKYIDTVKSDKPVSYVTFLGKRSKVQLPDSKQSSISEQRKYYVASFGFDNGLPKYAGNKSPDLIDIAIWKNGEPVDFMFLSKKSPKLANSYFEVL